MSNYMLSQYLSANGDGTGVTEATMVAGSPETVLYIEPPTAQDFHIMRMIVYVEDTGAFDADKYGNNITLTNGIEVRTVGAHGITADLTAGKPVLTNSHWARYCHDIRVDDFGTGNETLSVRWTFEKSGKPIILSGTDNERLEIVLSDDFSGLVSHLFLVQGTIDFQPG